MGMAARVWSHQKRSKKGMGHSPYKDAQRRAVPRGSGLLVSRQDFELEPRALLDEARELARADRRHPLLCGAKRFVVPELDGPTETGAASIAGDVVDDGRPAPGVRGKPLDTRPRQGRFLP